MVQLIPATEARRKTVLINSSQELLKRISLDIDDAINRGEYETTIMIDKTKSEEELLNAVKVELENLGYDVKIKYAEPNQFGGCPADQFNHFNGSIKINWVKKERNNNVW